LGEGRSGNPLAISLRIEIARRILAGQSWRSVAAAVGVARRTVDKYAVLKISPEV
jgi:hypothetical protein